MNTGNFKYVVIAGPRSRYGFPSGSPFFLGPPWHYLAI